METITWLNSLLTSIGLSIGAIIAGLCTVALSFLAARFGASESRRQFTVKSSIERLVAAGELVQLLDRFQDSLQDAIYDNENYRGSNGAAGALHFSFLKFELPGKPHELAATLGKPLVEDVILLLSKYYRAKGAVSATLEHVGGEEATEEFDKWAAALVLLTYELINKVNSAAGIRITATPPQGHEALEKVADDRLGDDEFAQLKRY